VEDDVDVAHRALRLVARADIALLQLEALHSVQVGGATCGQVVEYSDAHAFGQQAANEVGADEPRPAGHQRALAVVVARDGHPG
jgi:hypothetical protein